MWPETVLDRFAFGSQHLFLAIDRIDHDDLKQIFKVALKELHQRLSQLRAWVASSCFQCGDVVLRHSEPASELALSQMVTVTHSAKPSGTDNDIHVVNCTVQFVCHDLATR